MADQKPPPSPTPETPSAPPTDAAPAVPTQTAPREPGRGKDHHLNVGPPKQGFIYGPATPIVSEQPAPKPSGGSKK